MRRVAPLPADVAELVAAAGAVAAAFGEDVRAGKLGRLQYGSLLLLDEALKPFTSGLGAEASPGGTTGERPPGSGIGLPDPAVDRRSAA